MSITLNSYPEYKQSGVPWIGNVPRQWTIRSLGSLISARAERNRPDLPLLSVVRERGVILRSSMSDDENHNYVPDDLSNYKVVRQGDLVINKMKAWQGSLGLAPCDGIVSPAYFVFDFRIDDLRYGELLLRSKAYVHLFARASDGVRIGQWDLSPQGMKRIPVLVPSANEQGAIVRFVRKLNGLVSRLMMAKRREIELLHEQKQVTVEQVVMRGLDTNGDLKQSGVEWIPNIPTHWNNRRAKYVMREVDERSLTGQEELLSVSHLNGVCPRSQKNITMFMAESYVGHKVCKPNDLVINTMWAWMGALGVATQEGIVSPSYATYRCLDSAAFHPPYLDYLLRTKAYVSEFICRSTGIRSSRLRLYPEEFLKIPLLQPPLDEQERIVEVLRERTADLNRAIERAQSEIALLGEYRTRLIADVVTGKLDVSGVEVPELEDVEAVEPGGMEGEDEEMVATGESEDAAD